MSEAKRGPTEGGAVPKLGRDRVQPSMAPFLQVGRAANGDGQ